MEEDDFGDLYDDPTPQAPTIGAGSQQKGFPGFEFEEEDDEDVGSGGGSGGEGVIQGLGVVHPDAGTQPVINALKVVESFQPFHGHDDTREHNSDEDDDMLLLRYSSKSGLGGFQDTDAEPSGKMTLYSSIQPISSNGTQLPDDDTTLREGQTALMESDMIPGVRENGLAFSRAGPRQDEVPLYTPTGTRQPAFLSAATSYLDGPDIDDLTDHTLTIPGLSTTLSMPTSEVTENDNTGYGWDGKETEDAHRQATRETAAVAADEWDSDSEDDLQIVLNNDHSFYGRTEKVSVAKADGDSEEDEDEDLIIVAGSEPVDEGEEQPLPADAQAVVADGSVPFGVDRQTGVLDEKGLQEKMGPTATSNQPALRSGYPYHAYSSPFKYVRPGAVPFYGPGAPSTGQGAANRGNISKGVNGRVPGRGLFGSQTAMQLPAWAVQSGFEYTLPPSMTVFDIDLEGFNEKPWRHPAVDITDFFNFGFNEQTWKDYCKQLVQLRLESTMQSKIRVYESGRSEQEYDPDLPPELAAAAGLHETGERNQYRPTDSEATTGLLGRNRGHTQMIPTGRPIQVEGGLGDRRPSSDLRKQRIRDSDAIILIDAMDEEDSEAQLLRDETLGRKNVDAVKEEEGIDGSEEEVEDEEEQVDEEEAVDDEDKSNARMDLKPRMQQHLWHERGTSKDVTIFPVGSSQRGADKRFKTGLHSVDTSAFPIEPVINASVATGSGKLPEERVAPQRETAPKHQTPPPLLLDEKKGSDRDPSRSSGLFQQAQSNPKSINDDGDSHHNQYSSRRGHIQRHEVVHAKEFVSSEKNEIDGRSLSKRSSREKITQDTTAGDLQPDSPVSLSKRQRLVSPEGSQTASRDDFDGLRSSRCVVNKKESVDTGESAREAREDGLESLQSRKHKVHYDASKENHRRDYRELNEKNQVIHGHGPDFEVDTDLRFEKVQGAEKLHKRPKQGSMERNAVKESSKPWKETEEEVYTLKKEREEDSRRRGYASKGGLQYKESIGSRSDSRKRDDDERRDRQGDQRKRDEEEKRDRSDRGLRHKEKEHESSFWRSTDRKKREDEYRRKDRNEETVAVRDQKSKHRLGYERHDADSYSRRKEDESWKKDRSEENQRSKARDSSWREREEVRHRNGEYQDMQGPKEAGKSKHHDDERSWHGRDALHGSENLRPAEARDYPRDKRKHAEEPAKDKGWSHEGKARLVSDRESLHPSENIVAHHERSMSKDRSSGKHGRPSDERRVLPDKHRSNSKRNRDSDKETNDSASQLGATSESIKRRKSASDKKETSCRKDIDPLAGSTIGSYAGSKNDPLPVSNDANRARTRKFSQHNSPMELMSREEFHSKYRKDPGNEVAGLEPAERGLSERETEKGKAGIADKLSEDQAEKHQGRSKIERWMSQKDLGFDDSRKHASHDKVKKLDKRKELLVREEHSASVGRLHDDTERKSRHSLETEKRLGSSSASTEQANGKVTLLSEDWKLKVQNDRVDDDLNCQVSTEYQEQYGSRSPATDTASKMEKRRERFKLPIEDYDMKRIEHEEHREGARNERPARKRRWLSG